MNKFKKIGGGFLCGILLLSACQPEYDKFERPDWIEGRLFEQLQSIPGTDSFEICLVETGYDSILNNANFTVFAPLNEAFETYFMNHPSYHSVNDIPEDEILRLVKRHIIQNPWSRDQLQGANEYGWVNPRDSENDLPWSYKRQTLQKDENRTYFVLRSGRGNFRIVDSTESNDHMAVYQPSRKYVPVFFDRYMDIAGISSEDFAFYFDRPFEHGYLYLSGAKLSAKDHFAENGFIYTIDRVVPPLRNAEQLLENPGNENDYSMFLDLIYEYPVFRINYDQTNLQAGADEGLEVPYLYDLDYEELVFDIHEEAIGENTLEARTTTRYHHGMLAPTNQALQDLIDNVLTVASGDDARWPSFDEVPDFIKRIIVNAHMSKYPIYLSGLEEGFLNGEWDTVVVDPSTVIEKHFGSNATFLGINKASIPRAFSSVTAPVYLYPKYAGFMEGLELSGLAPVIKKRSATYSYFITPASFGWDQASAMNVMADQVGLKLPGRKARYEYIPTLGGNYILFDTLNGPKAIDLPTDNGRTYAANGLNWSNPGNIYWLMRYRFTTFFNLMDKAGMVDRNWGKLNFINESEYHTIFVPNEEVLANLETDSMTLEELQQFIKYHFVSGVIMFTDGNKPSGRYFTLRLDESSSPYNARFSTMDITTEPGMIMILDNSGNEQCIVPEYRNRINMMFGSNNPTRTTMGVIHEIDTVLSFLK